MDLPTDFIAYLASLDISVSAFSALSPVDRSAIRRDFNISISPGGGFGSVDGARGVVINSLVQSAGRASLGSAVDHISGPAIQPPDSVGLVPPVINIDRDGSAARDMPPISDAGSGSVRSVSVHSPAPASDPRPSLLWDAVYIIDRPGKVRITCVFPLWPPFLFYFLIRALFVF